jgi:hypothetical protein
VKIETRTTHKITFSIVYFERNESGMESDSFGKESETISEAIENLRLANASIPGRDWIIVCNVSTSITEGNKP